MNITPDLNERVLSLRDKFCQFGECGPPADMSSLPSNLPEIIIEMLKVSGEWHVRADHCGAFGCNLFEGGNFFDKLSIMGDEEGVKDWKDEHSSPNCGEDGWECFCIISEYDYMFVCVDANSPHYGSTRHIVNNCFEDSSFLKGPFEDFFETLEGAVEEWIRQRNSFEDQSDVTPFAWILMN